VQLQKLKQRNPALVTVMVDGLVLKFKGALNGKIRSYSS
jgi:hypothetical protein